MKRRNFLKTLGGSLALLKPVGAGARASMKPLELTRDGQSTYSIAISREASLSEKRGSEELQRFLEQMSGAHLPIVTDAQKARGNLVLVGKSDYLDSLRLPIPFASLGAEGFAIKTAGSHLVIAGGRQRGTMYGVYTFLEKLGCRWFATDVSRIPKLPTITVQPLDEIHKPAFEYREPFFSEAMDRDWAARNKMNGAHMYLDASTGGKIQYHPFVHSFYGLIPPRKYFKDHPEYFSFVDGRRRGEAAQLCLTNPDVLRLATEQVFEWIQEHPEATIVSVSQNDYWGWCECENCLRVEQEEGGAHSGPVLRFVNAVAAEVAKKYPDKLIDTLAYAYTETPPAKVRPLPNVRVRMCPIGACQAHPYEKCRYDTYIMNHLRAWRKITDGALYIWHYNADFSHYLRPFPDFGELAADIPMYRRHGVVGLFMQGVVSAGGGGENAALRSYVMARLLWDTNTDVRRDIEEFHQAFYGKAAPAMLAYFDLLQRVVNFPPAGKGDHCWCCSSPHFSDDFLAQAKQLFGQAQADAENEVVRKRVRQAQLSLDYLEFVRAKKFRVQNGAYEPADLADVRNRYQSLISQSQSFGITDLGEGWTLDKENKNFAYVKSYPVKTLENPSLLLHIAPELSGRVIQMIDKRTGHDAVVLADPEAPSYPDVSGLVFSVYEDYLSSKPLDVKWETDAGSQSFLLALTGTCAKGLRLKRTIQIPSDGASVHTETIVQNVGNAAIEVVLQSRFDASPTRGLASEEMDDVSIVFSGQDGKALEKKLIDPELEPVGADIYTGTSRPDGEWRMVNRRAGFMLTNRFTKAQVERCFVRWGAKNQNVVGMVLWSEKRRLEPGESMRLDADYDIGG
jgi:hypothetical protein